MIYTHEIEKILYKRLSPLGVEIEYVVGNLTPHEADHEHITVYVGKQTSEPYWRKCPCEVHYVVPDIAEGIADKNRLGEMENTLKLILGDVVGYDFGETYTIEADVQQETSEQMRCNYVTASFSFDVLNTNKQN